jgi:hypothetical protein
MLSTEATRNGPATTCRGELSMSTYDNLPAPKHGLILTHFLTVRDVAVSRQFYADILGGEIVLVLQLEFVMLG